MASERLRQVDNISQHITSSDLRELFGEYGAVGDVYIPADRYNPRYNRGFAFVRFFNEDDADDAIDDLDGYKMGGLTLVCSWRDYPGDDHTIGVTDQPIVHEIVEEVATGVVTEVVTKDVVRVVTEAVTGVVTAVVTGGVTEVVVRVMTSIVTGGVTEVVVRVVTEAVTAVVTAVVTG